MSIPYAIPVTEKQLQEGVQEEVPNESHYKKNYEIFITKQNEALLDLKKYTDKWKLLLLSEIENSASQGINYITFKTNLFSLNFRTSPTQIKTFFCEILNGYITANNIIYNKEIKQEITKIDYQGTYEIIFILENFFEF